jgi:hypothetical protein
MQVLIDILFLAAVSVLMVDLCLRQREYRRMRAKRAIIYRLTAPYNR